MEEAGGERRAVERAAPGAGEPHRVVRVHVRQEEEAGTARPPHAPEIHGDGRTGDHRPAHGERAARRFPPNLAGGAAQAREGESGVGMRAQRAGRG